MNLIVSKVLLITLLTLAITAIACYKEKKEDKLIYIIATITVYLYSGLGIGYDSVEIKYLIQYSMFLGAFLFSMRATIHSRILFNGSKKKNQAQLDFDCNSRLVSALTVVFFLSISAYLFFPSFQLGKLFRPSGPISTFIYEQRAATESSSILSMCETISTASLPFFCLYLKRLVDKKKKPFAVLLILLWAYIDYVQYNYLGRYQILVYFALIYFICVFVYPNGVHIKKKYLVGLIALIVLSIPLLVAYTEIRKGSTAELLSVKDSIPLLIETECGYPRRYYICEDLEGTGSIISFLMWMLFLPIPSFLFIFGQKPTFAVAHQYTYVVSGRVFGSANYSSNLPSVLGEGIIVWGMDWVWLHGIVIGVIIAFNLRFLRKKKSLSILYIYMLIQLTTLGRGGAQSYMGSIINGTVFIMMWWWCANHLKVGTYSFKHYLKLNDDKGV